MDDNDKQRHAERAIQLIAEQNLAAAVLAGAVATVLAAVAYGIVVAIWPYFHGFAAAGVGMIVGLATGFLGRGIRNRFAVIASVYTIVGCLLGNAIANLVGATRSQRSTLLDVIREQPVSALWESAISGFGLITAVYWLVAIACAAFLSRRPLSRSDRLALGLYRPGG